jgi:uncharacterized protein (TIGR02117 family)
VIRKILRIIGRILLGFLAFITVYLLVMFILSLIPVNTADEDPRAEVPIYIKSNGVHTDVVVPAKNDIGNWTLRTPVRNTRQKDSLANWVAFGWGDHDFYLNTPEWSDLKMSTALNAAFYRGTGLMHVGFYRSLREDDHCRKIMISKAEYQKLTDFINASFELAADGNPVVIENASYGNNDSFYKATGKYNLFYTCNSWANNALRNSGQRAALWTLTDTGIFRHYE